MPVRAQKLLQKQDGCVAVWQLRKAGLSEKWISALARDWQQMHDGVYAVVFGEITPQQRWRAATLTTPTSVLSHFSAAARYSIYRHGHSIQSITRPGDSGMRQTNLLVVHHSLTLAGDTVLRQGMRITTAERTIIDLSPALDDRAQRKMVREALRIKVTSVPSLDAAIQKHHSRRGTATLRALTTFYSLLQLERCKSDAEAYAMELLAIAKRPLPDVNKKVNELESDLSWPAHKLIIEIDGPQFHRDKLEDAHKTASWEAADWTVRRIPSDDIFNRSHRLLALAPTA